MVDLFERYACPDEPEQLGSGEVKTIKNTSISTVNVKIIVHFVDGRDSGYRLAV